jgi:hypothetical protein
MLAGAVLADTCLAAASSASFSTTGADVVSVVAKKTADTTYWPTPARHPVRPVNPAGVVGTS